MPQVKVCVDPREKAAGRLHLFIVADEESKTLCDRFCASWKIKHDATHLDVGCDVCVDEFNYLRESGLL